MTQRFIEFLVELLARIGTRCRGLRPMLKAIMIFLVDFATWLQAWKQIRAQTRKDVENL